MHFCFDLEVFANVKLSVYEDTLPFLLTLLRERERERLKTLLQIKEKPKKYNFISNFSLNLRIVKQRSRAKSFCFCNRSLCFGFEIFVFSSTSIFAPQLQKKRERREGLEKHFDLELLVHRKCI